MDERGPSLPLGSTQENLRAVPLTNAQGSHAILVRAAEEP